MELNREQVIAELLKNDSCYAEDIKAIQNAIALINELAQANEQLSESYDHLEKTKDELLSERARLTKDNEGLQELVRVSIETQNSMGERIEKLTEENESLDAEKGHLELVVEGKLKRTSALERQVLSLTEENERLTSLCTSKDVIIGDMNAENERLRAENKIEYETPLGKQTMPNLLHLEGDVARLYTQIKNETKADTVREVCGMFKGIVEFDIALTEAETEYLCYRIDDIEKEMLEGNE